MKSAGAGRVGITVQRSRKSCGSWSITVDNSTVVNIAVTHTGESRSACARLPQSSATATHSDGSWTDGRGGRSRLEAVAGPRTEGEKPTRTCDDPHRGGEWGASPRPTRGGRSRTGLARSRTIRDFHGVPESPLRQTHAPHLTPNGLHLCSGSWKTPPCLAQRPSLTWTRRSLRSRAHSRSASRSTKAG